MTGTRIDDTCASSGAAALFAPSDATSATPLVASGERGCFASGGCTGDLVIELDGNGSDFHCFVELPAVSGDAFFDLPTAAPGAVSCSFTPDGGSGAGGLTLVSGAVDVREASSSGFQAAFALELQTSAGEIVRITGGRISVSDCHPTAHCSY